MAYEKTKVQLKKEFTDYSYAQYGRKPTGKEVAEYIDFYFKTSVDRPRPRRR